MQLNSPSAVLAAISAFPATIKVNAGGIETREVCRNPDDVRTLMSLTGFRYSIDHAVVELK